MRLSVAALAVALFATGAEAAEAPITISLRDTAAGLVLSGTASGARAGELVEIQHRACGDAFWRLVGGTQTADGGAWREEVGELGGVGPGSFRARWRGHYSSVVPMRFPLRPNGIEPRPNRVWRIHYLTLRPVLTGRLAELQRKTGDGRWVRIRTARFVRVGTAGSSVDYAVSFRVPTRGLTLRVFVPRKTAAPCFLAGVSQEWRS